MSSAMRSTNGASFTYWLKKPATRVTVDILDSANKVVRSFGPTEFKTLLAASGLAMSGLVLAGTDVEAAVGEAKRIAQTIAQSSDNGAAPVASASAASIAPSMQWARRSFSTVRTDRQVWPPGSKFCGNADT